MFFRKTGRKNKSTGYRWFLSEELLQRCSNSYLAEAEFQEQECSNPGKPEFSQDTTGVRLKIPRLYKSLPRNAGEGTDFRCVQRENQGWLSQLQQRQPPLRRLLDASRRCPLLSKEGNLIGAAGQHNSGKSFRKALALLVTGFCFIILLNFDLLANGGDKEPETSPDPRVSAESPVLQQGPVPWQNTSLDRRSSRWGIMSELGIYTTSVFDPYGQNPIKGDFPVFGNNTFMVLTGIYVPKSLFNNQQNVETQINNEAVLAGEIFHGATVFKPKDWSVKSSGKAILNRGNGNDVEDFAFLELFGELKLFDVGPNFDFTSTRNGIQFFKTDFNGFIFQDFNLGYQLFGELGKNRYRWTAAFADLRAKENGLLTFNSQNQDVYFANWFWEDFLSPGYNTVLSFHYNRDRSNPESNLDVFYTGIAFAGHWGRFVFNPAFYYAFGTDQNGGNEQKISAFLAGAELAYPINFLNYRSAAFVTSPDSDPNDNSANGFASINEAINLFGAGNSFIIGGNAFTKPNSFIPSNQGVSAFVNPGILLLNTGLDVVFTPKLFFTTNFNYAQFLNTSSVEATDNKDIGFEVNAAINYRLFLNENFLIQVGANAFFPQKGGTDILGSSATVITSNVALQLVF